MPEESRKMEMRDINGWKSQFQRTLSQDLLETMRMCWRFCTWACHCQIDNAGVDLRGYGGDAFEMKPKVGEMAPEFNATVVDGDNESQISLSDLRGERVVLVFYPRDNTPGCTIQACSLRDHWEDIKDKAKVFGVSADSVLSHRKFISKKNLPYPLIADEEKTLVNAYGVWVQKSMMGKKFMGIERSTFVIGADGKLEAILEKVSPMSHREKLIKILG